MQSFILMSSESYMSHTTHLLHQFVSDIAHFSIHVMELLAIFIILYTTVVAFYKLITHKPYARVFVLHGQSVGLTFKLGAEILSTVTAQSIEEIYQIMLLIVLKALMILLIDWELHGVEDPYSSDGFTHHRGMPHFFSRLHLSGHKDSASAAQPKSSVDAGTHDSPQVTPGDLDDRHKPLL